MGLQCSQQEQLGINGITDNIGNIGNIGNNGLHGKLAGRYLQHTRHDSNFDTRSSPHILRYNR